MSDTIHEGHKSGNGSAERAIAEPENLRRDLWLDLEDTVITPVVEGWWKVELINIEKVKRFIAEFKPTGVHIFSFAIWNERERDNFTQAVRPMLEKALGVNLGFVLTVDDDIIPVCCKVTSLQRSTVDFQEMSNFWGKQGAFRLCMQHFSKTNRHAGIQREVVLLDDAVFNESFEWPDVDTRGRILNIDQMQ